MTMLAGRISMRLVAGAALVFASSALVFASSPLAQQRADAPAIRAGDQWTYQRTGPGPTRFPDEIVRIVVTNPSQRTIVESVRTLDLRGAGTMESGTRAGREQRHLETLETLPARVISGRMPLVAFPIEVGKTWRYTRTYADAQGVEWTEDGSAAVETLERIEVPAGSFEAYRIRHRYRVLASAAPDRTHETTLWYAPEVRRWVRLDYAGERRGGTAILTERYRLELTSFDVQP